MLSVRVGWKVVGVSKKLFSILKICEGVKNHVFGIFFWLKDSPGHGECREHLRVVNERIPVVGIELPTFHLPRFASTSYAMENL